MLRTSSYQRYQLLRCFARKRPSFFCRFAARRVLFRLGRPVAESSSTYAALRAALCERLRVPDEPPPALRFVALTPGNAVSTGQSRAGRLGYLSFFSPERSAL